LYTLENKSNSFLFFIIGSNSITAFDPEKRAKKTINDHLESVRNLALSRDGRREASRSIGLADSAAKKGTNFTTPLTNTSLVNVSKFAIIMLMYINILFFIIELHIIFFIIQIIQHTAPPLTVIQELEKSILFFTTHGPPEALQRAVKELGEVYESNSRKRRIEEYY
jgi:hypothetical protein